MIGKFIVLEGTDGTGKTTQAKLLRDKLVNGYGIDCILTREPGGTPGAEQIRKLIVEGKANKWGSVTDLLLILAARIDHINQVIRPALTTGKWVICDRFELSTLVYQSDALEVLEEVYDDLTKKLYGDIKVDHTILLDAPTSVTMNRLDARKDNERRFESKGVAYLNQLRNTYGAFFDTGCLDNGVLVDASGTVEEVRKLIWAIVKPDHK